MTLRATLALLAVLFISTNALAQDRIFATQSNVVVTLFSELCVSTRGVSDAVAASAQRVRLKPPQRSHHKLNFLDSYDQTVWRGDRNGVAFTLVSRSNLFCQVIVGPPAAPLQELAQVFGKVHETRPIFRNPTVIDQDGERREVLGFRLKVETRQIGKVKFTGAADVAVEYVSRGRDAWNRLTLTN